MGSGLGGEMGFQKIGLPMWVRRFGWIWIIRFVGFDGQDERSVGGCVLASHWWVQIRF